MPHRANGPRWFFALIFAIAISIPFVSPAPSKAEPQQSGPTFVALKTDGARLKGSLKALGADGAVLATAKEGDQTIAWNQLVKLSRDDADNDDSKNAPISIEDSTSPPYPPHSNMLVALPEGDRIAGEIQSSDDEKIDVESRLLGVLKIPLQNLSALVFQLPNQPKPALDLLETIQNQPKGTDALWLANGDIKNGGFLKWDAKRQRLQFQLQAGPIELEPVGIRLVNFDPALANYPKPEGIFFETNFADGTRLGLTDLKLEQGELEAKTRFGAVIRVSMAYVSRMYAINGSVTYLSNRDPDATQYAAYIVEPQPYRKNRNVEGLPLLLNGQIYDRGLGVQSRTLLAYRLEPKNKRFQALVGLDDQAGPQGSVVFRVLVDREEKFKSPLISFRDPPQAVDVDVSGGRLLILIAEFGSRGEVRDWADWIEARLINE